MSNYLFRAKDCCGAVVKGGIYDTGKEVFIVDCFQFIPVKRGTVAQFIATDKNGHEVYEGDNIIIVDQLYKKKPFPATFTDIDEAIIAGYVILAEATSSKTPRLKAGACKSSF